MTRDRGDVPDDEIRQAMENAAKYQDSLARAKFDQETQRDKTLVLISGGALTVSFAFLSTLVEHRVSVRLHWLIAAWIAWVAVLIFTVFGYTLSIRNYNYVISALSRGEWGKAREVPKLTKVIEPLNIAVSVSAVLGFTFFGYFAIGVLERVSNERSQVITTPIGVGQKESQQEVPDRRWGVSP